EAHRDMAQALALAPLQAQVLAGALDYELSGGAPLTLSTEQIAKKLNHRGVTANELLLLAWHAKSVGKLDEGIGLASKAVALDSSWVDCYERGAELWAAGGDLRGAVDAGRVAIALSGESARPAARERLRALEARLAQQTATPAATP